MAHLHFSKDFAKALIFVLISVIGIISFEENTFASSPVYIYGIDEHGNLKWYRHNGGATGEPVSTPGAWDGPHYVGVGWQNFERVFPGTGPIFYAVDKIGDLLWYRHNGFASGSTHNEVGAWDGPTIQSWGWQGLEQIFSGSDGVIYAITKDGTLRWYRHKRWLNGDSKNVPGAWEGPKVLGTGWQDYKKVFSGCKGTIYAITQDGTLKWLKHLEYLTGGSRPSAWLAPRTVGIGWQNFQHVFPACNGIIYAVTPNGELWWYKHNGANSGKGLNSPGAWEGPKTVSYGWQNIKTIFAIMPGTLPIRMSSAEQSHR